MQTIIRTFLRGLLAFLPIFITLYAVYYAGSWLNRVTANLMSKISPELAQIPGLGIAFGLVAILLLGVLVSSRMTRWIYRLIESPLRHLPIIKELYTALSQLTEFLTPSKDKNRSQVVRVRHPDHPITMIGLLTRENVDDIDITGEDDDHVAVYLPMSYQIGGFTLFVPRSWIAPLDIPVETALRETLTGWMQRESKP